MKNDTLPDAFGNSLLKGFVSLLALLAAGLLTASRAAAAERWLKGNTHAHSLWSDGDDLPEMVADAYKRMGYDFLVLSDHNGLSRGERWRDVGPLQTKYGLLDKSRKRYGEQTVTIRKRDGHTEARLLTLEEVRKLTEEPGRFILIEGEEITGEAEKRPAHVNAINIEAALQHATASTMVETLLADVALTRQHASETGRPVFNHVNHPNWRYGISAAELAALPLADGFELINAGGGSQLTGDVKHVSMELMWDWVNTVRLLRHGVRPIWGVAADDSHNYHQVATNRANAGRAWVMVGAPELKPDAITGALCAGRFYASCGVTLQRVAYDATARTFDVDVAPEAGISYRIDFIGTPRSTVLPAETNSCPAGVGKLLESVAGPRATYRLKGDELYVRAVVRDLTSPPCVWGKDRVARQAWTQPVGWEAHMRPPAVAAP